MSKNSKKKVSCFKVMATTGAIISSACAATGYFFIEKFLSKKGIQEIITKNNLISAEDSACFVESPEALAGTEFYQKRVYKDVFTFNKYSECLHAIYYEAEKPSDVYAISCHGFTGDPSQNSCYARRFFEMGFNVLLPYSRAHGKSEHKYSTMGWFERLDLIDWINYIIEMNPNAKIILHGVSMGAATVMMATGEALPENVVCAIEDCGFTSLWDEYSVQIREMFHLPADLTLEVISGVARVKLGLDFRDASALKQVKKSNTPTLFIHGDKDDFVPFWMHYPLYQSASCEKESLVVPGATHAGSAYLSPELYWDSVSKFIKKYI